MKSLLKALSDAFDADYPAVTVVLARKVLKRDPQHAVSWLRLGSALADLANYDEAEHALKTASEYCEESLRWVAYAKLGHLFRFRGDYETAAKWYSEVIRVMPDDASGYIFLGAAHARMGNLTQAEALHRTATGCSEGCIDEAWHNVGLVLRGQGRYSEARDCFLNALRLDPQFDAAQEALADVDAAISWEAK